MLFMKLLSYFSAVVFGLNCASVADAATVGVVIGDFWFNPTNVVIRPGDRVVWTNAGFSQHDSTSRTGLWESPNIGRNGTYGFTFTNLGYYPYYCEQHRFTAPQQTGSVSVVNISLASAVRTPTNMAFQIRGGRQGLKAAVDVSGRLGTWTPLGTNNFPSSGTINFTNTAPPPTNRFYRVRALP